MTTHKNLTNDDIHALTAATYADIAARDADSAFNTDSDNLNKLVRVDSPLAYYVLASNAPTWTTFMTAEDFLSLSDTPSSYSGEGGKSVQVNGTEDGLEFVTDTAALMLHLDANSAIYPSSNPAAANSRNGHPVIAYDDTTAENIIFNNTISDGYGGEDINIDIDWVAETAITGGVTWGVEVEANAPGGNDIDSDSFDTQQTGTSTTNGTSGIITRTTITLTQAEADAIAASDAFRLRLQRVVSDGGDDMTGDAQIVKTSMRV